MINNNMCRILENKLRFFCFRSFQFDRLCSGSKKKTYVLSRKCAQPRIDSLYHQLWSKDIDSEKEGLELYQYKILTSLKISWMFQRLPVQKKESIAETPYAYYNKFKT